MEDQMLTNAFEAVEARRLKLAIAHAEAFLAENPYLRSHGELERIREDYRLMLEYMRRGFTDPQRERVYHSLLMRTNRCLHDLSIEYKKRNVTIFIEAAKTCYHQTFSKERVRQELEAYVADVAMLSLEPDGQDGRPALELHERHQKFMSALFCHLLTSRQWAEEDADFYLSLLTSPTTDATDVQLITSAVTLAAMNEYDLLKFATLLQLYQKATDEHIRQRALVGWVFAMNRRSTLFPRQDRLIEEACRDERTIRELADLQKQVVFCMKADADYEHIKSDIMPNIIRNNGFHVSRQGIITEKEDDPMEDILAPGAADRRMEEMEESIQKMVAMQNSGSDIYFGGFSQMKRFAFFYTLCNWFTPFYLDHPGLASVVSKLRNRKFMVNLMENGPFCDSDKYSFALAMSTVFDRLPENMRHMLDSAEAIGPTPPPEQQQCPAYIRRMYLQDLYRFFRVYPQRNDLANPFGSERFVFTAAPSFAATPLVAQYAGLCSFFRKQKNAEAFGQLVQQYQADDVPCKLLRATYFMETGQPRLADPELKRLLELDPNHERGLQYTARRQYQEGDFQEAAATYAHLHQLCPESKSCTMNYSLTLCKAGRYDEAIQLLYKLDYDQPGQPDIMRLLAWAMMGTHREEQAVGVYQRLLQAESPAPADHLNAGYAYWFRGDVEKAADCFRSYAARPGTHLENDFAEDKEMLLLHDIGDTDIALMLDLTDTAA